jgi:hypothetical protein
MKTRILVLSLALIVSLAMPLKTLAQGTSASTHDWSSLKAVPAGEQLAVKLKNGKTVEGKLSSVSDTVLTISGHNQPADLKREEILKVYRVTGASIKKPVLIGAVAGAATGGVLGAAAGICRPSDIICFERSKAIPVLAAFGTGVGALVGLAVGKARHKRVLIYEA